MFYHTAQSQHDVRTPRFVACPISMLRLITNYEHRRMRFCALMPGHRSYCLVMYTVKRTDYVWR